MQKALDFFKTLPVFYCSTVEDDQPHVRPVLFCMGHEGKLYFVSGSGKRYFRQLQKNPKFEMCGYGGGQWIRLSGVANFDPRPEVLEKVFEIMPQLARTENENNKVMPYYVTEGMVEMASMKAPPTTFKLE